ATGRFHDPCHAREWTQPGVDEEFTALVDLLVRGLS
ncbi:TetR/AcrR family transcriptional regulator, partial [Streptomyces misionensis]